MPLQIRRGTEAERQVLAVAPAEGELIWITDAQRLYIGDGTTLAVDLPPVTGYTDEDSMDAAAGLFTSGTHTNISFTYDDINDQIDATVDLSDYNGVIKASAFNGSLFADDSTELVNAVDGTFNLDGTIKGNIVPDQDQVYDLGSAANRFKDLWLSGSSIQLGGAVITSTGSAVDLPAGSTVGGALIGSGVDSGNSLNVDIIGDDSSVIVNSSTGRVTGTFVGDLSGSVFGDNSEVLVNSIDNILTTGNLILDNNILDLLIDPDLNIGNIPNSTFEKLNIFTNNTGGNLAIYGSTNGVASPGSATYVSRGLWNNPTTVQQGDNLKTDIALGYDGSNYLASGGVNVIADPWIPVSVGNVPGTLVLGTYTNGDANNGRGIIIDSRGYCSINQPNQPREMLDVGGNAIIDGTITGDLIGSVFTDGSTMVIDGTNGNVMYSPANAGDWVGLAPTTIQEAIDRIAAALGPIA